MTTRCPSWPEPAGRRRAPSGIPGGLLLLVAACGGSGDAAPNATERAAPPRPVPNIVEMAVAAGQFSTLLAAVEAAGLTGTLQGEGPFTVFAPTDGAFSALPPGTVEALLQDTEALKGVLLHHVVPGRLTVRDLRERTTLETVDGRLLQVAVTERGVTINGAYMLTSDVGASNGIIHVMTSVLVP